MIKVLYESVCLAMFHQEIGNQYYFLSPTRNFNPKKRQKEIKLPNKTKRKKTKQNQNKINLWYKAAHAEQQGK